MHKLWKCLQNFFWKPCKLRTSKMHVSFFTAHCCISLLWPEWFESWKCVPHILENVMKLCFVKFSHVKEIASKFYKCWFPKFLLAGVPKKCRKCRFFQLRGNTAYSCHVLAQHPFHCLPNSISMHDCLARSSAYAYFMEMVVGRSEM